MDEDDPFLVNLCELNRLVPDGGDHDQPSQEAAEPAYHERGPERLSDADNESHDRHERKRGEPGHGEDAPNTPVIAMPVTDGHGDANAPRVGQPWNQVEQ